MSPSTTAGHHWPTNRPVENLDFADLEAAGQPVFSIAANSLGAEMFYTPGVLAKIATLGGPGLRGEFVFGATTTENFIYSLGVGSLAIPGAVAGDAIEVSSPPDIPLLFDGYIDADNQIQLTAKGLTTDPVTIPIDTILEVMAFHP